MLSFHHTNIARNSWIVKTIYYVYLTTIVFLLLIISSCNPPNNQTDFSSNISKKSISDLRDSADSSLNSFYSKKDSLELSSALEINTQILQSDQNTIKDFERQIEILNLLGMKDEAFYTEGDMLNKYKKNTVDQLIYKGIQCKLLNHKDSMNFYFTKALNECNQKLANSDSKEYAINKIEIYAYLNNKSEAWKVVNNIYEKSPNDQFWKNYIISFDNEYQKIQNNYKDVNLNSK